jgi:hypothetical protein
MTHGQRSAEAINESRQFNALLRECRAELQQFRELGCEAAEIDRELKRLHGKL